MHKNLTNHTVQLAKADPFGYAVNRAQSPRTPSGRLDRQPESGVREYCGKGRAPSKGCEVDRFYCGCYFYYDAEAVNACILYHTIEVFDR